MTQATAILQRSLSALSSPFTSIRVSSKRSMRYRVTQRWPSLKYTSTAALDRPAGPTFDGSSQHEPSSMYQAAPVDPSTSMTFEPNTKNQAESTSRPTRLHPLAVLTFLPKPSNDKSPAAVNQSCSPADFRHIVSWQEQGHIPWSLISAMLWGSQQCIKIHQAIALLFGSQA